METLKISKVKMGVRQFFELTNGVNTMYYCTDDWSVRSAIADFVGNRF